MSIEKDEAFFRNFYFILAALVVVAVIAIFGASHIYQGYVRSQQSEDEIADRIRPVGQVNVSGEALTAELAAVAVGDAGTADEPAGAEQALGSGEAAYRRICFSCHDMGIGGAPKTGDPAVWAERTPKGLPALMQSVIDGVTSDAGIMLPRGGLPDMTDEEIEAAINYMLDQLSGADSAAVDETAHRPASTAAAIDPDQVSADLALAVQGEEIYETACWVCHAPGAAGAPRLGDKDAWEPLIAKGTSQLVRNSIDGFTGDNGTMPPRGARPDLSDGDVEAAVIYMVENSR